MTEQKIDIHLQSGTGEVLRIAGTILMFGGAGALAWTVAQGPNAELAASGMTMMIVMMIRLMYARGMVALPAGKGGDDFAATKGAIAQIAGEYRRWLAGTSMLALAAIAFGYAIAFLLLRTAVSAALGVFANLYVAGSVMAMVGAVVVAPSLIPSILASLKRKGVVTEPAPQVVQPAPVRQAAPAPAAPTPQQSVAPRKVVRKVVKKDATDV